MKFLLYKKLNFYVLKAFLHFSGPVPPLNALAPLDQPEKGLNDAILSLSTATSDQWEVVTQAMYTVRRLVTHHPHLLEPRFHDVIISLNKHVSKTFV